MSADEKDEPTLVVEETEVLKTKSNENIIGSVLVIGGGISGIQSSLDLADAGFKVYIVEKGVVISIFQ